MTLKSVGTQSVTLTDTLTSSITGTQGNIVVAPGTAASLVIAGPTATTAGAGLTFTLTAQERRGNTATGYGGTVHFANSDPQAALPGDYVFVAADHGVHAFASGVVLKTASAQVVTAGDTGSGILTTTPASVVVTAAGAQTLVVSGPTSSVAGATSSYTVTAKDAYGNTATGYTGTVHWITSDTNATLPVDYAFVAGDGGAHAFASGVVLNILPAINT